MKKILMHTAMALGALLSTGVQNRFAGPTAPRKLAPNVKTRSWLYKGGKRSAVYPGQTPEQATACKALAQAKRDRKATTLNRNTMASAIGYHPFARIVAMGKLAHPIH